MSDFLEWLGYWVIQSAPYALVIVLAVVLRGCA